MPAVVSLNVSGCRSLTLNDEKRTAWLLGERLNAWAYGLAWKFRLNLPGWSCLPARL